MTTERSLRERREALLARRDLKGPAFCRTLSDEADEWLSHVAERATHGSTRHLALVAVGGYGRRELSPYSDLDVVLLHDGRSGVRDVADAIWYPVWDQGVQLDHSVRQPADVLEAATGDLRVALGLLDARRIWGDPHVAEPLVDQITSCWQGPQGVRWLDQLAAQMDERHRTKGEVAFLLEPDLKDGHGGLRDVHIWHALARFAPLLRDYIDLEALQRSATHLLEARVELHRNARRAQERLVLQEQDPIAATLDYKDADALMAAIATDGRRIAWISDEAWRRRHLWQPETTVRRPRLREMLGSLRTRARPSAIEAATATPAQPVTDVESGLVLLHGEVALRALQAFDQDPTVALRLAAVAAERDLPIAPAALCRLSDRMPPPPDPWPSSLRQALVRVLGTGRGAIPALETLDQYGLLVRLLPEWSAVRNLPQRNAYHRFTVDRHLLEAAANAAALTDRVDRPDLLLVGTFLHDIGKGFPGDHTKAGIQVVGRVAQRMGYPPADIGTLELLVRHHLLLPDTATRRDLDDPATIETVAHAVGDTQTLELLAALTEADATATGPAAWGAWTAGLVQDLTERVRHHLTGRLPQVGPAKLAEVYRGMVDPVRRHGRPVITIDPPRVVVAAPDRPGLLATVAGMLALHRLSVRSADAASETGVAVEVFTVEAEHGRWPDSTALTGALDHVLEHGGGLEDRLAEKARDYAAGRRPVTARPIIPEFEVHNDASATSTVVDVRAADEIGLLHRLTRTLFDLGLDVVAARVATLGDEVVDAFYVRGADGVKVTDPALLAELEAALSSVLKVR